MYSRLACAIGAMLVFIAAPLSKAIEVGDKPSLSFTTLDGTPVDLKDYRGKLVIVDFFSANVDASRDAEYHYLELAKNHSDDGVVFITVCYDFTIARAKSFLEQAGIAWPVWLDGKKTVRDVMTQWNHPSFGPVLIGPDGSVLWSGWYAQLDEHLTDALATNPPSIIDPAVLAKDNAALDAVEKALKANDNIAALKALADVSSDATKNKAFAARMDEMKPRIDKATADLLSPVDDLIAQHQNIAAIARLNDLLKSLKGSPVETQLTTRLQTLETDPLTKAQSQQAENEQKAAAALARARTLRDGQKLGEAFEQLKDIVTDYPGTPSADAAADMVKSFEQDPEMMKQVKQQIADAKADGLLTLARSYVSAGLNDKARAKFQEVLDGFPGSAQADSAKKEMDALN